MKMTIQYLLLLSLATFFAACGVKENTDGGHDIVIIGARVIDPETQHDAVVNIGIKGNRIATITADAIEGEIEIDAGNLIAAPGFIDLHNHGQDPYSEKLGVRDGRTSQLDLEGGAWPIPNYYEYRRDNSLANYGVSVGLGWIRMQVLDSVSAEGSGVLTHALDRAAEAGNRWATAQANEDQLDQIDKYVVKGLNEGGLGVGVTVGYFSDESGDSIARVAQVAKEHGSFLTTHSRYISLTQPSGLLGLQEMISLSTSYDVPLLIHHVPTNALADTPRVLDMIDAANANGAKLVGEVFPYVKGSTFIGTRILDDGWQERTDMDYDDLQWVETGETLTQETFDRYRRERPDGWYIMEHIKEKDMMAAVLHPEVFLGSDGMPYVDEDGELLPRSTPYGQGFGHPRGAGSYGRYLRIAIDDGSLTMPQIVAKTGFLQAKFLEQFAPEMKERGRIQEGMFADIAIFDPRTVDGKADYERGSNSLPSIGITHVIVNGELVVRGEEVVSNIYPGTAIRNAAR